ncbi:high mobility group protein B3 [Angomonas deanei]|nr:high mobility group protein B3 [Angomonas deanei]|eukprot:EPY41254.1 high mobility group protein B3 [Angomonas deanei]
MKEAAELWKNLGESEKAKYLNMAAEDKKRFDREVEAFKAKGGVMVRGSKKEAKVKKAKKDPNAPKRAKNAYMFFATEFRTKHPELSMIEQTKAAGEAWRNLADDAKKPYEAMAAKDRERYENEKSA